MYIIPFVFLIASFFQMSTGYFFTKQNTTTATGVMDGYQLASAQTDNFMVYRAAVMSYAEINPAATGTIANALLPLPAGFISLGNWTNTLTASTIYVYSSTGTEGAILAAQPGAPWLRDWIAGYNQNGTWVTGSGAGTGILPGYIPNGSVTAVIQR